MKTKEDIPSIDDQCVEPPGRHHDDHMTCVTMDAFEVPVVDLSEWVGVARGNVDDCRSLAQALHVSGV